MEAKHLQNFLNNPRTLGQFSLLIFNFTEVFSHLLSKIIHCMTFLAMDKISF